MKKVLIILALVFIGFTTQAQTETTKTTHLMGIKYYPIETKPHTFIALSFTPTVKDSTSFVFDKWVREGLPYRLFLKAWVDSKQWKVPGDYKFVEVRVTLYGKTTDYTFEEFEQLIYLK